MADHRLLVGDQLDNSEPRAAQLFDKPGFVRPAECCIVETSNRIIICELQPDALRASAGRVVYPPAFV